MKQSRLVQILLAFMSIIVKYHIFKMLLICLALFLPAKLAQKLFWYGLKKSNQKKSFDKDFINSYLSARKNKTHLKIFIDRSIIKNNKGIDLMVHNLAYLSQNLSYYRFNFGAKRWIFVVSNHTNKQSNNYNFFKMRLNDKYSLEELLFEIEVEPNYETLAKTAWTYYHTNIRQFENNENNEKIIAQNIEQAMKIIDSPKHSFEKDYELVLLKKICYFQGLIPRFF